VDAPNSYFKPLTRWKNWDPTFDWNFQKFVCSADLGLIHTRHFCTRNCDKNKKDIAIKR